MTKEVLIHGSSDDRVLLQGAISDQLTLPIDDEVVLEIGPFTIEATYDIDGHWRFDVLQYPNDYHYDKLGLGQSDAVCDYSESVLLNVNPEWVVETQ